MDAAPIFLIQMFCHRLANPCSQLLKHIHICHNFIEINSTLFTLKVRRRRRHEFRYAKCARQTFMGGGASAAGRMKVYFESPSPQAI